MLTSGLLEEKTKLKEENKRLTSDNQMLRDQLTILRQECKHLGKRPVALDQFEESPIEESVARQIKRRRKQSTATNAQATLTEMRATDRGVITMLLRQNQNLLSKWSDALQTCVEGKGSKPLVGLRCSEDFIDGFELRVHPNITGPRL